MILPISILVITVLSVILAVRAAGHELSVPSEVAKLRIKKRKGIAGVIIFLKKKIIHYSSSAS